MSDCLERPPTGGLRPTGDVGISGTTTIEIRPVTSEIAGRLRSSATVQIADVMPGYPCRQCLRDAEIGDEVVLVSFDPFEGWPAAETSPYRGAGPIFLHRHGCSDRLDRSPVPYQLARRQLSVRAFDPAGMMCAAELVDGRHLEATSERLLSNPDVDRIHVHNAGPGCFAATVRRR